MQEYLCEMGLKLYREGRYEDALNEFRKALLVQPDYTPALKYIQMIKQTQPDYIEVEEIVLEPFKPSEPTIASKVMDEILELIQLQREMISLRQKMPLSLPPSLKLMPVSPLVQPVQLIEAGALAEEEIALPKIVNLQEDLSLIRQPIEVEKGKTIDVVGSKIQRFLITHPEVISIERVSPHKLSITGKEIGYTYVHFWDDSGRSTLEFLVVHPKPEGPTLEEQMRLEEERAGTFKFRYSLDWRQYEKGRRLSSVLRRQYYTWYHRLNLTGSSPYGNFDSTALVRKLKKTTDLTFFTLGLTDGQLGNFKDFSLRGFDFSTGFGNLIFPGTPLRGVMLKSPAFNKKIDYTAFWGREGGGRFGNLSPGLGKIRHSFLKGGRIIFYPSDDFDLGFTTLHGYGRQRPTHLNSYAYDLITHWRMGLWGMGYEVGHDGETSAHLLTGNYTKAKNNFSYELRNISKDFLNIAGETWRRGEVGGLFTLTYQPADDWFIYNRLDVYRDRLFPAQDEDDRLNEDYDLNIEHVIDPLTNLKLSYNFQNDLGKIIQHRYISPGLTLSKTFKLKRNVSSYIDLRHQESKNYGSTNLDYINEKVSLGFRLNLVGQLYYFLNKQWNWLEERATSTFSKPHVLEMGLDLNSQIGNSPFHENIRLTYRDEQNATSNLSFLSGEDYLEGYAELAYRPVPGKEAYCSMRIRNVWQDRNTVEKRIDADFNAGLRYLWDTGIRWESIGNVEGYVFRDLNSDGLRQNNEAPVEGVRVWLGKNKFQVTDLFGYYKFKSIRAKKSFLSIDTSTLPSGSVLTVPLVQEALTVHRGSSRVDFGIIWRSEISGMVFEDLNDNNEYDHNDKGIQQVVMLLEDGRKALTDGSGRYTFNNVTVGEHTLSLDLNTLPVYYLPKVSITSSIDLAQGVTYLYNIPLRRIKEE